MSTIAIVYYSSQGHTHTLAESIANGIATVSSMKVELHRLLDSEIQNGRWKNDTVVASLMNADAIVFGTPTYMGGYAAQMKAFIDACGGIWFRQGWKDKVAAGFTHSQGLSGDKLNTLQSLQVNALQHGMIWVGNAVMVEGTGLEHQNRLSSYTGLMAQTYPAEHAVSEGDQKTAQAFGQRIAETTMRWVNGKK